MHDQCLPDFCIGFTYIKHRVAERTCCVTAGAKGSIYVLQGFKFAFKCTLCVASHAGRRTDKLPGTTKVFLLRMYAMTTRFALLHRVDCIQLCVTYTHKQTGGRQTSTTLVERFFHETRG